jgi:hypothetical protein
MLGLGLSRPRLSLTTLWVESEDESRKLAFELTIPSALTGGGGAVDESEQSAPDLASPSGSLFPTPKVSCFPEARLCWLERPDGASFDAELRDRRRSPLFTVVKVGLLLFPKLA